MTWTPENWTRPKELLRFLSNILHGVSAITLDDHPAYLAVSADCTTIYYRALFEEECFDDFGRTVRICPGRVTLLGALRDVVIAEHLVSPADSSTGFTTNGIMPEVGITKIARDYEVRPLYIDVPVHIEMKATLKEYAIAVSTNIVSSHPNSNFNKIGASLHTCIHNLLLSYVGKPCGHNRMTPLIAKSDELQFATFLTHSSNEYDDPFSSVIDQVHIRFFALKGAPLKQLLQMGLLRFNFLGEGAGNIMLQGQSCLNCAINELREKRSKRLEKERIDRMTKWSGSVEKGSDVLVIVMT